MGDVLILGETNEGALETKTLELFSVGRKLAVELNVGLSVIFLGDAVSKAAEQAATYGPARVIKMEHPLLRGFAPELWIASLEQVCKQIKPQVLLMSQGPVGSELGPRLAYRLNSRVITDCIDLSIDRQDGRLLCTKAISGGNAISVLKCAGEPQMATVRGKIFEPAGAVDGKAGIENLVPEIDESMIRVKSIGIVKEDVVSLDVARVVVSGGAGLGDKDGFELLEDLAKVLEKSFGSVMIGCSRVAVDKGWISADRQVGLTGSIITPEIYVAIGISGASHHLAGMIRSQKIIAINTDKGCNMFRVADYGVVEDYQKIIPALTKRLEELS